MFTLGQAPFAASSEWNTAITQGSTYAPLAWPSATGYNYWVNWDTYSPSVYVASASDPIVKVSYPAGWGYPGGTVSVHMPAAADGADGTDGELLVIDGDIVYNFWTFNRTSLTTATAGAFGQENIVTGDGWGSSSPFLSAGITAIGSSMMGGLLVKAETDTGVIQHALQLAVDAKLVKSGFTGEAIAGDGGSPTGIVLEGDLLAIPPGTPMPSGLSPLGKEVFIALQTYGAYVVDVAGGVTTVRAQENAYDNATIQALRADMNKVLPLLQDVTVAAGGPPITPQPPTTTDPLAPTIAAFSPDSSTVGDGITNASILTLTGTAAAGNTVKVYDGTSLVGTATANSSGAWSLKTGTLANTTHNFTATATNAAGGTSPASSVLSVKVDTVAPAAPKITGFSPDSSPVGDGSTNANTLTLTGTAEANSSVRILDGTTLLGTAKANASGAWSYTTAALASGAHAFAATAIDVAGNTGAQSVPLTVTVQQSTNGQNLIVNGGFETGDFSGWTLSGNVAPLSYGPQAFMVDSAKSGDYAAGFGPVGSDGKLSQDIQTTAGQHYTLTFWLANSSGGPDDFAVKWNGQTLLAMVNQSAQGYTEYKFDVVGAAGTSHLEFDFRQDPSYWSIDSISLSPTGAPVTTAPATTPSAPEATSDTIAPTLADVTVSRTGGWRHSGDWTVSLEMSENVTVNGTPMLLLDNGQTATYKGGSGTDTLTFYYNSYARGLHVSGIVLPAPSSITDLAGNVADLSGAANSAGPSNGDYTIAGTTVLELFGASSSNVSFASGSQGELKLDDSVDFAGQVLGFGGQNLLDLADIDFGANTTLAYKSNGDNTGGTLTISDGAQAANIALLGQYTAASFAMSADGFGGTMIQDAASAQPQVLTQPQHT